MKSVIETHSIIYLRLFCASTRHMLWFK